MRHKKYLLLAVAMLMTAGCEHAREFHYHIRNGTREDLRIYIDYSISARGHRQKDTMLIKPGQREQVYTHAGLGGFYTGAIEKIRFSGQDTFEHEWRNRKKSRINKHFFRRNSWKIIQRSDDHEHYQFTVKTRDFNRSP